ncbi:MAG: RES domain-containing protein, partial [Planctomycetota bacterium]
EAVWVQGNQMSMDDFLRDRDVPDELHDEVAGMLQCSNCGSELDITCEVGPKCESEKAADERWAEWTTEYEPKLQDFFDWLAKYPYLGSSHPIGKEILDNIGGFPEAKNMEREWWRARPVRSSKLVTPSEMGPPPEPPASEGRYSHHGQQVFYLASTREAAVSEVLDVGESLAWVQKFGLQELGKILDLRAPMAWDDFGDSSIPLIAVGLNWSRAHTLPDDPDSEWKPQYFLPRYIADCARSTGFTGIEFDSRRHYGTNLVLLDWDDEQIQTIGEPEQFTLRNRPTRHGDDAVDF